MMLSIGFTCLSDITGERLQLWFLGLQLDGPWVKQGLMTVSNTDVICWITEVAGCGKRLSLVL